MNRRQDAAFPVSRAGPVAAASAARPMVLIVDGYYASLGGNQRYICMLLAAARRAPWRAVLACPGEGPLTEAGRAAGAEVHVVRQPRRLDRGRAAIRSSGPAGKALTALALVRYNLRLIPLLRRLRPDAIQVHSTRNALMAGLAARLTGVPMILFVKGAMDTPLFDRIAVMLASRTVFLTGQLKPAWFRIPATGTGPDSSVLRIGIDLQQIVAAESRIVRQPPADVEIEPGTFNLAFAGWLTRAKGVRELIEAFALALRRRPECRLHIIGASNDDDYASALRALARKLVPPGAIRFLGWRTDVLDVLAALDAYVLPSFSEGVPRSVVEAMALGKPVIATRVGGVPELLGDGVFGIEVEAGNVDALAGAIVRLAADVPMRNVMSQLARAEAHTRYSFDAHLNGLWSILDSVRR